MNLECNVGRNDKNIRIAAGVLILVLGLFAKSLFLLVVGAIVLATGVLSFCALYKVLGTNTATQTERMSASTDLRARARANVQDAIQAAKKKLDDLRKS